VKASVDYADIPLPFGEMHTENAAATDLVRAAVVAQLAKPAVAPSGVWLATKTVRLQLLTWAGIVGGSITLFSNLRGLFTLADWASWIVTRWHKWAQAFWTATFSWIGIHFQPTLAPSLSFAAFLTMLVVGTILRMRAQVVADPPRAVDGRGRPIRRLLTGIGCYVIWFIVICALYIVSRAMLPPDTEGGAVAVVLFIVGIFLVPLAVLIGVSKERLLPQLIRPVRDSTAHRTDAKGPTTVVSNCSKLVLLSCWASGIISCGDRAFDWPMKLVKTRTGTTR
jgi:hypothetical protein